MTDRELMQMALDALDAYSWEQVQSATAALRERLAQPEPYAAQAAIVAQQTQGRMYVNPVTGDVGIGTVKWDASAPLVVHPHPAFKKPWVGLTDEEIIACIQRGKSDDLGDYVKPLATSRAVEAKLKEKNT